MTKRAMTCLLVSAFLSFSSKVFAPAVQETLLSDSENAYSPVPSPDGTMIAYVCTDPPEDGIVVWGGRSSVRSQVKVMTSKGQLITSRPLADTFLSGWTLDGRALVCYRDWRYYVVSLDGRILLEGQTPESKANHQRAERVSFLSHQGTPVWIENDSSGCRIQTPDGTLAAREGGPFGQFAIPSTDERYIAVSGGDRLWIYDTQEGSWADLGEIVIHPGYSDWHYVQPSWDPWFRDSRHVVFVSSSALVVSSPDGRDRQVLTQIPGQAGLAAPSPDGRLLAYVTFEGRARELRPDLTFFGDTTVWVIPNMPGSKAFAVSEKNKDTTYAMAWLSNHEIVFDRLSDDLEWHRRARLWKVRVAP